MGAATLRRTPAALWVSQLPYRFLGPHFSSKKTIASGAVQTPSPYYVTTPIFYVNADPHIGHLHSCVMADVLKRWHQVRHRGWSTMTGGVLPENSTTALLSTGTDEHGIKVQKVAERQGVPPRELCDKVSRRFRDLADAGGVEYTTFIRTTEERHKLSVHEVWNRLTAAGHIYKSVHEGWYAESDEAFYPEGQIREVIDAKTGDKHHESIETGKRVEWSSEENYKFRMSRFRDRLIHWLESDPDVILPRSHHAKVLAELRAGIDDISVSRPSSRVFWGIPVPNDPSQSIYVWVDALINYLTVTGFPSDTPDLSPWPADVHVIGKDILRFHAIYWPAILMAASLPLPGKIVAHSHWTMNKTKMSKSQGNVIEPFAEMDRYGRDTVRFFLCQFGGGLATDSDYSHAMLRESYRRLQGQLGNLASRVFSPSLLTRLEHLDRGSYQVVSRADHGQPDSQPTAFFIRRPLPKAKIPPLDELFESTASRFEADMTRCELAQALDGLFKLISEVNARLQIMRPWWVKASASSYVNSLYEAQEVLRLAATLLEPFMPSKMRELRDLLQMPSVEPWEDAIRMRERICVLKRDEKIEPLFPPLPFPEE